MQVREEIKALLDAGDWFGLLAYYWTVASQTKHLQMFIMGGGVLLVLLILFLLFAPKPATTTSVNELPPVNRKGSKPKRAVLPMTLGNVTVDLQPGLKDILQVAVGGTTRLGKSTAVMGLYDLPIGILTVALDDTVPISEKVRSLKDGDEWTSDPASPLGLNLLDGPPQIAAEVLVGGFGTVGTGKWQRIARDRLWGAIDAMDKRHEPRSMLQLAMALMVAVPGNAEATRACRDWAERLLGLSRVLGPALGHDLNLVDAMRHQRKVLLRMNHFLSPLDAPMLGGMLLVKARMVAASAGVPFILVIEEAGQMAQYQQEIAPLTQAGGARGVTVVIITQNLSLLPLTVTNNISVWVTFAQEDATELRFAAAKMRLEPEQLYREAFPGRREVQGRGWCYVRAPGVPTTLVQIQQQKPKVRPHAEKVPARSSHSGIIEHPRLNGWYPAPLPLMLPEPRREVPWWVGNDPDRLRALDSLKRAKEPSLLWHPERGFSEGTPCLEWVGALTGGRPKMKLNGLTPTVYRLTWEWANVRLIRPSYEIDHLCGNPCCCDPEHLEEVTSQENIRRRSGRKAALVIYLRAGGLAAAG